MNYKKVLLLVLLILCGSVFVGAIFVPKEKTALYVAARVCKTIAHVLDYAPSSVQIIESKGVYSSISKSNAMVWAETSGGDKKEKVEIVRAYYDKGLSLHNVISLVDYESIKGRKNVACHFMMEPIFDHLDLKTITYNNKTYTNFRELNLELLTDSPGIMRFHFGYAEKLKYLVTFSFL